MRRPGFPVPSYPRLPSKRVRARERRREIRFLVTMSSIAIGISAGTTIAGLVMFR